MKNYITKIFYHPVKARVIYDFLIAFFSCSIIIFITNLFFFSLSNFYLLILLPLTYTSINYLYGIYGTYRLATITKKIIIICYVGLTTLSFMYLFKADMYISSLSVIFSVVLSSIARWLTNLPHQSIRSGFINSVITSNQPILVVGGAGYIGSHVVRQLLENKEKVRLFDKFVYNNSSVKNLLKNKDLEIVNGDVSDLYALTLALKDVKAVVHLAGIVGDPAASIDENLTRHINIVTTRMLKETVKAFKIPKFIFASSCSVYGATEIIVDETNSLNPVSLYAQSKIDSEKDLLEDPHDDFHPTVLRFATVFGHSPRMRFDLVLNLFCAQAYNNGKITVYGGNNFRPFIHAADIAKAIVLVLRSPQELVSRQIFNVGDDRMNITINDLAEKVAKIIKKDKYGRKVKITYNKNTVDKRNYNVSFEKIRSKLNYSADISFEDGIKEIYRNLKSGVYKYKYTDRLYSNYETTKIMRKEFRSKGFRESHYSTLLTSKRKRSQ